MDRKTISEMMHEPVCVCKVMTAVFTAFFILSCRDNMISLTMDMGIGRIKNGFASDCVHNDGNYPDACLKFRKL